MKKIFLTGILSILFVGFSFAQTKIGVTAGLNVSSYSGDVSDAVNFKAGFQAGLVMDLGISKSFSVIPELLFSQRGAKYKDINISETLNYLQIPINAAYKLDAGYGSNVIIFAGPYFGYGISGSDGVKFGSKPSELKPFDFGIDFGIGYEYEKIFFKLQCNPGFLNMSNVDNLSARNMNIAITVGYFFN